MLTGCSFTWDVLQQPEIWFSNSLTTQSMKFFIITPILKNTTKLTSVEGAQKAIGNARSLSPAASYEGAFPSEKQDCSLRDTVFIVSSGQERQNCVCSYVLKRREKGKKEIKQVKLRKNWRDMVQGTAVSTSKGSRRSSPWELGLAHHAQQLGIQDIRRNQRVSYTECTV